MYIYLRIIRNEIMVIIQLKKKNNLIILFNWHENIFL